LLVLTIPACRSLGSDAYPGTRARTGSGPRRRPRGSRFCDAARAIRDRARTLGREDAPEVRVKVGIHWGATLTVGQVSTGGRLEVTALGDEMNEAARIESAVAGDIVLASKDVIERLSQADAKQLSIEPDSLTYRTIAELTGAEKEVRDAGSIAVVKL
jgi:class 3 adenylate cyclase